MNTLSSRVSNTVTHSFQTDLAKSNAAARDPRWDEVYRKAFPQFVGSMYVTNVAVQGYGVDRVAWYKAANGLLDAVVLEEKLDDRAVENMFLEEWSSVEQHKPGWVSKDLACDYVLYVAPQLRTAYLIPWSQLRHAWAVHNIAWSAHYGTKEIPNRGYTTVGVAVPIDVVLAECPGTRQFDWPEIEQQTRGSFRLGGRQWETF